MKVGRELYKIHFLILVGVINDGILIAKSNGGESTMLENMLLRKNVSRHLI